VIKKTIIYIDVSVQLKLNQFVLVYD